MGAIGGQYTPHRPLFNPTYSASENRSVRARSERDPPIFSDPPPGVDALEGRRGRRWPSRRPRLPRAGWCDHHPLAGQAHPLAGSAPWPPLCGWQVFLSSPPALGGMWSAPLEAVPAPRRRDTYRRAATSATPWNTAMAKPRPQRETPPPRGVEMPTRQAIPTGPLLNARWPCRPSVEMQGFSPRLERAQRLAMAEMARMVLWSYILYISTLWAKYPTSIDHRQGRDGGRDARNSRRLYLCRVFGRNRFRGFFRPQGLTCAAGRARRSPGRAVVTLTCAPALTERLRPGHPHQGGAPRVAGATVRVQRWIARKHNA